MADNFTENAIIALLASLMTAGLTLLGSALGEVMGDRKSGVYFLLGSILLLLGCSTIFIKREKRIGELIVILLYIGVFLAIVFIIASFRAP
jgi:hypothetical protein